MTPLTWNQPDATVSGVALSLASGHSNSLGHSTAPAVGKYPIAGQSSMVRGRLTHGSKGSPVRRELERTFRYKVRVRAGVG
jgi:hypothetical protein